MCERVRGEGARGCGARVPVMVGGVGPVAVEYTHHHHPHTSLDITQVM